MIYFVLAQGGDPTNAINFAELLSNASPALMLALFIVALQRRWLVLPREIDYRDQRIVELEQERDEYRGMVFQALKLGETVVEAANDRPAGGARRKARAGDAGF